jgi:uncharacterized protein YbcI
MASAEYEPELSSTTGQRAAQISNAVVRIQREFVGRGPTKARTTIREDAVLVLLHDMLTKAERSLVADGRENQVLEMRHSFQGVMRSAMVEVVQEITGRKVIAFMSDNHIDPDMATEVFVLAPGDPDGDIDGDPRVP